MVEQKERKEFIVENCTDHSYRWLRPARPARNPNNSVHLIHAADDIGPLSAEGPSIERLHHFTAQQALRRRGKHRETYRSDFRF